MKLDDKIILIIFLIMVSFICYMIVFPVPQHTARGDDNSTSINTTSKSDCDYITSHRVTNLDDLRDCFRD